MEATDVQSRIEQLQLELEEQERNFRQVLEERERENEELRRRLAEGIFPTVLVMYVLKAGHPKPATLV